MTHPTIEQIDAAIEEHQCLVKALGGFETDSDRVAIFALRFLRVMMQEPIHELTLRTLTTNWPPKLREIEKIFKAMRDEALKIAGRE